MPTTQYIYVGDPNYQEPEHWTKQGSNIFYNSGNVGIGQAIPLSKLVVDGSCSIGEYPYSETPAPLGGLIIQGDVGIGTTSPTENTKLDVRGNTKILGDLYVSGTVSGSGISQWTTVGDEIYINSNVGIGTNNPTVRLDVLGNTNITGDLYISGALNAPSTQFSQWTTSGANIYYNSGNVGVGITNPSNKLHIVGSTRIEGDLTVNGTQTIIDTNVNTTERLVITNDGTGPALEVNQKGTQPVCDFQDDGTTALKIINGGNVGIGTATPNYKLDVQGDANFTSYINPYKNIVQIEQAYYSQSTSAQTTGQTIIYSNLNTGTITPRSSSNKIFVEFFSGMAGGDNTAGCIMTLERSTNGGSSYTELTTGTWKWAYIRYNYSPIYLSYVDSPATTSSILYRVGYKQQTAGNGYATVCLAGSTYGWKLTELKA